MKKIRKCRRGFTLVELIVVIVIILVLAAVLVPTLMKYVGRAQLATCVQNRRTIYMDLAAQYTEASVEDESVTMDQLFEALPDSTKNSCPAGGEYTIEVAEDGYSAVISCSEHGDAEEGGNGGGTEAGGLSLLKEGSKTGDTDYEKKVYELFSSGWGMTTISGVDLYTKEVGDYVLVFEIEDADKGAIKKYAAELGKTLIYFDSKHLDAGSKEAFNEYMGAEGITINELNLQDGLLSSVKYDIEGTSPSPTYQY